MANQTLQNQKWKNTKKIVLSLFVKNINNYFTGKFDEF